MRLEKCLSPKINRKIIGFFLENPSSVDTARGIATWTGEDVNKIKNGLDELVKCGALLLHGKGAAAAYSATPDANILSRIRNYLVRMDRSHPPAI